MMTPLEARLTEENAALRLENRLLREKVDLLIRRIFGKSSEHLDEQQLMLLLIGEEVTEQLDYEPARFLRRRIIRRKYVKRDEPHQPPIIAPLNLLQERSIAAPGLLAQIIVAKYCDHLPLHRNRHAKHPLNGLAGVMAVPQGWGHEQAIHRSAPSRPQARAARPAGSASARV